MIITLSISNFKKTMMKNKIENTLINEQSTHSQRKPILTIVLKSLLVSILFGAVIFYSDYKGYFNPDGSNNHTKKKWDSFYAFTKKSNVDILLIGNSHLYSGINPKNLSCTMGLNAFILASPGTNVADSYFGLKEALKCTSPKLVVLETYGINNFNPYALKSGGLSDQFKSFYARKNFLTKFTSTPFLFKSDNYFYAWSNTLRNHDFIFNDTLQLAKNKILITNSKRESEKTKKLYLGRFVRFQTGIKNDVLAKYDTLGAPVNGALYTYSNYAETYVDKIVALCKEKSIELVFLTLPMYDKHISNYKTWKGKTNELLGDFDKKWINMQFPYDAENFTTACFENTYSTNQHMTYNGSLIATYKLADFIKTNVNIKLPNRKNETGWKNIFYGEEGYFENNPVLKNDEVNQLLSTNFQSNNVLIDEVSLIKPQNGKNKILMAKIDKSNIDLSKSTLRIAISYVRNNQLESATVDLQYDYLHEISNKYIFKTLIKPIDIKEIKAAGIF